MDGIGEGYQVSIVAFALVCTAAFVWPKPPFSPSFSLPFSMLLCICPPFFPLLLLRSCLSHRLHHHGSTLTHPPPFHPYFCSSEGRRQYPNVLVLCVFASTSRSCSIFDSRDSAEDYTHLPHCVFCLSSFYLCLCPPPP